MFVAMTIELSVDYFLVETVPFVADELVP